MFERSSGHLSPSKFESTPGCDRTVAAAESLTEDLSAYRRKRRARMSAELRRTRHRSLPSESADYIDFAQTWAPYGGPPAEDILVRYGMTTKRFLDALANAIASPSCDPRIAADLRGTYLPLNRRVR